MLTRKRLNPNQKKSDFAIAHGNIDLGRGAVFGMEIASESKLSSSTSLAVSFFKITLDFG
jgi:hypothetical protein